jgi:Type II secretion system (T2SS), protein E, N-terminal domain
MGTATLHFDAVGFGWRGFWRKIAQRRDHPSCVHFRQAWPCFRSRPHVVLLEGSRYCTERCLETALRDALQRVRPVANQTPAAHRIPLGLLLLSRQQLTAGQLRIALETQQTAGHGRIGDWLQSLGFASELQVTAALARQWSCPLLRTNSSLNLSETAPRIPRALLDACTMVPVNYVEATATLHLAVAEGIDYTTLYAIEQMTGCHTEPCMAAPSFVRARLQSLASRPEHEFVFECVADAAEFSRIVCSYAARLTAMEIRLAACGSYAWVRLLRRAAAPQDLLLRLRLATPSASPTLHLVPTP